MIDKLSATWGHGCLAASKTPVGNNVCEHFYSLSTFVSVSRPLAKPGQGCRLAHRRVGPFAGKRLIEGACGEAPESRGRAAAAIAGVGL